MFSQDRRFDFRVVTKGGNFPASKGTPSTGFLNAGFVFPLDADGGTCYTQDMKTIIPILAAMALLACGCTHCGDLYDDRTVEDSSDAKAGTDGTAAAGCRPIKPT
jgi:hypothetical protein